MGQGVMQRPYPQRPKVVTVTRYLVSTQHRHALTPHWEWQETQTHHCPTPLSAGPVLLLDSDPVPGPSPRFTGDGAGPDTGRYRSSAVIPVHSPCREAHGRTSLTSPTHLGR